MSKPMAAIARRLSVRLQKTRRLGSGRGASEYGIVRPCTKDPISRQSRARGFLPSGREARFAEPRRVQPRELGGTVEDVVAVAALVADEREDDVARRCAFVSVRGVVPLLEERASPLGRRSRFVLP